MSCPSYEAKHLGHARVQHARTREALQQQRGMEIKTKRLVVKAKLADIPSALEIDSHACKRDCAAAGFSLGLRPEFFTRETQHAQAIEHCVEREKKKGGRNWSAVQEDGGL